MRATGQQLRDHPEQARTLREELAGLIGRADATHLLTEAGLLDDGTVFQGLWRRLGEKVFPRPVDPGQLEHVLAELVGRRDRPWVDALEAADLRDLVESLFPGSWACGGSRELASAMVILATRIAGGGVHPDLVERMDDLEGWNSPFLQLARSVDHLAEAIVDDCVVQEQRDEALAALAACEARVRTFRAQETTVGTTLALSGLSLRMAQQLYRLRLLVQLTEGSCDAAARLVRDLLRASAHRDDLSRFAREKVDTVAYLVVGNAAEKGEGYLARDGGEARAFLKKSLVGGLLVAPFACLKVLLPVESLALLPKGLLYGANYAACFALIYLLGATLATKQPAMTASHLAQALESDPDSAAFAEVVRSIWRSQAVSFVGNIGGAVVLTVLLVLLVPDLLGERIDADEVAYLSKTYLQWTSLLYAGIAGVLLSLAGMFSAFIDNAVVFYRFEARLREGRGLARVVPRRLRPVLSEELAHAAGGLTGNVVLGFLLGSAGTFGIVTGLPVDIRHIAFASSHATLILLATPLSWTTVLALVAVVLLIGVVNFVASFGFTIVVAIEAGRLEGVDYRRILRSVLRRAWERPFHFLVPIAPSRP